MSDPTRYGRKGGDLEPLKNGEYVRHSDYAALAAEVERLRESQLSKDKWIACEQMHFQTADNLRDKLYQACLKIERLEKAGDLLMECYCYGDLNRDEWKEYPVVAQWLAAKESKSV